jgi:hypothetical protein
MAPPHHGSSAAILGLAGGLPIAHRAPALGAPAARPPRARRAPAARRRLLDLENARPPRARRVRARKRLAGAQAESLSLSQLLVRARPPRARRLRSGASASRRGGRGWERERSLSTARCLARCVAGWQVLGGEGNVTCAAPRVSGVRRCGGGADRISLHRSKVNLMDGM